MRRCVMVAVVLMAALSGCLVPACGAGESLVALGEADSQWTATALAGNATGLLRLGWRPGGGRVAIFGQGDWLKDIGGAEIEGFGAHIGATYDVIEETPLTILKWTVPTAWYIGCVAGAVKPEDTGWQTSPGILTGFTFGSQSVRVVVEGLYSPGASVTDAFAEINDKARLVVGAEFRL